MREPVFERFISGIIAKQRVRHAYLIEAADPAEQLRLAEDFTLKLNCPDEREGPCRKCPVCTKIMHRTSPDFLVIEPEGNAAGGGSIKIGKLRELVSLIHLGPSENRFLVVVIREADRLTKEAANAFLKNLEEPPERVIFILLTAQPAELLPTILSRCQTLSLNNSGEIPVANEIAEMVRPLFEFKENNRYNLLQLAQDLGKQIVSERKWLEDLYALLVKSNFPSELKVKLSKLVLEALRSLKLNANPKLTIDWLFVNWGETIRGRTLSRKV